jgi:O-methyltransferase domain
MHLEQPAFGSKNGVDVHRNACPRRRNWCSSPPEYALTRFPKPRGLVFDQQHVVAAITTEQKMQGRITSQGGSFFDSVPKGADIYVLIRVVHDWPDEDVLSILRSCRKAMGAQAVLLLGERLLQPDFSYDEPAIYLIDVQMMAMFGLSRERSEIEFRNLLEQAGFSLRRVIATASPLSIIEAAPV